MSDIPSLQRHCIKKGWTVALAESCTGGALSAALTAIPDASLYFLGSVVAYSNSAKQEFLSVSAETLKKKGAVSQETAEEMALGAKKAFDSTCALATTGIAGPSGGSREKPVGLVWFAVALPSGEVKSWKSHFSASRDVIIAAAVEDALVHLEQTLYTL